jgi:hypothetical protein
MPTAAAGRAGHVTRKVGRMSGEALEVLEAGARIKQPSHWMDAGSQSLLRIGLIL